MGNFNSFTPNSFNELNISENEITEEFFKSNYKLISSIDCGGFGQVLKYEYNNEFYAIKEIKIDGNTPIKLNDIKNEILILQYVNNLKPKLSYFVKYFGYSMLSSQKIAIIYELADGNLADLANNDFLKLDKSLIFSEYINILSTLVKALTFLELHNIAHIQRQD